MSDIVVTVPKNFRYGKARPVLAAWLSEGDAPGEAWDGEEYCFTTHSPEIPDIEIGERVYVVCEIGIVGYAPLVDIGHEKTSWGMFRIHLIRAGAAVACTIPDKVVGFRGWRRRWWDLSVEQPLDLSPWLNAPDAIPRLVRTARVQSALGYLNPSQGVLFAPGLSSPVPESHVLAEWASR